LSVLEKEFLESFVAAPWQKILAALTGAEILFCKNFQDDEIS